MDVWGNLVSFVTLDVFAVSVIDLCLYKEGTNEQRMQFFFFLLFYFHCQTIYVHLLIFFYQGFKCVFLYVYLPSQNTKQATLRSIEVFKNHASTMHNLIST